MTFLPPKSAGGKGSQNVNSTLDEGKVRMIRQAAKQGVTAGQMARLYGVSAETIRRVIRYETWAWLSDEGPVGDLQKIGVDVLREEQMLAFSKEPTAEELEASHAKLEAMMRETRPESNTADKLLDEMLKKRTEPK
jgi:transposase-like protein